MTHYKNRHLSLQDGSLRPYHHHNSVVTHQDGLLKDQQIIVPSTLWLGIRKILHQGHLGIEKTKSLAR